jgi:anti-sigma regulatory factor (Ser/Thr protein kinase)
MTESSQVGPVRISLPPDPALSRVVRLAASGMASLAGFTVDKLEDIKVAVSEVMIALIEHGGGKSVEIEFAVDAHQFVVNGRTIVEHFDSSDPDLLLCRTVLADVCDRHTIEMSDGHLHISTSVDYVSIA